MPERKPIEEWAKEKKTPAWLYQAAKKHARWAIGQEVTAEAYDQKLKETAQKRIG